MRGIIKKYDPQGFGIIESDRRQKVHESSANEAISIGYGTPDSPSEVRNLEGFLPGRLLGALPGARIPHNQAHHSTSQ